MAHWDGFIPVHSLMPRKSTILPIVRKKKGLTGQEELDKKTAMPGRFIEVEEGASAPERPKPQKEPEELQHEELKKTNPHLARGGSFDLNPFFDDVFKEAEALGANMARGFTERFNQMERDLSVLLPSPELIAADGCPVVRVTLTLVEPLPVVQILDWDVVKTGLSEYQLGAAKIRARERNHILHPGDTWNFTLTSNLVGQSVKLIIDTTPSVTTTDPRFPRNPQLFARGIDPKPSMMQRIVRWFSGH